MLGKKKLMDKLMDLNFLLIRFLAPVNVLLQLFLTKLVDFSIVHNSHPA